MFQGQSDIMQMKEQKSKKRSKQACGSSEKNKNKNKKKTRDAKRRAVEGEFDRGSASYCRWSIV